MSAAEFAVLFADEWSTDGFLGDELLADPGE